MSWTTDDVVVVYIQDVAIVSSRLCTLRLLSHQIADLPFSGNSLHTCSVHLSPYAYSHDNHA